MPGHSHNSSAETQNQGNTLGDRSCVRQSKLYRMYESGNNVKDIMGTSNLVWDVNEKSGAYSGQKVFDHNTDYNQKSNYNNNYYDSANASTNVRMPYATNNTYIEPNNKGNNPTSLRDAYEQRLSAREQTNYNNNGGVAAALGGGGYTTSYGYSGDTNAGSTSSAAYGSGLTRTLSGRSGSGGNGYAREPQRRPSFGDNAANIIGSGATNYYGGGPGNDSAGSYGIASNANYASASNYPSANNISNAYSNGAGYNDSSNYYSGASGRTASYGHARSNGSSYAGAGGPGGIDGYGTDNNTYSGPGGGVGVSIGSYASGRRASMEEPEYGYRGGNNGIAAINPPLHSGRHFDQQTTGGEPRSTRPW